MIEWFGEDRWRASLGHVLMALVMMVLPVFFGMPWMGVAFVAGWFWSREKVQAEYRVKGDGQTVSVFWVGWMPWEWDKWSRVEFFAPVVVAVLVAIICGVISCA